MMQLRKLAGLLAAACLALGAFGASSALASEVKANFSAGTVKLTTTGVTVKKAGTDARTCTLKGGETFGEPASNTVWLTNDGFAYTEFTCTGGTTLSVPFYFEARYDTVTGKYTLKSVLMMNGGTSPWGGYGFSSATFIGDWTNGSGGTNSTLTFNEKTFGNLNSTGQKLTMNGTFTATTSTGGLITLSH